MPPGDGEKDPDVRYTDVTEESGKLATNQAQITKVAESTISYFSPYFEALYPKTCVES